MTAFVVLGHIFLNKGCFILCLSLYQILSFSFPPTLSVFFFINKVWSINVDITIAELIVFCVYISLSPFHSFDNPVLIVTVYLPWDLDMCHSNVLSPMSFPLWAIYHNKLHKCLFTGHLPLLLMQIAFAWKLFASWALPALGNWGLCCLTYRQSDWTLASKWQYYSLYELILCNR